jgi:hypothetical protein
MQPLIRSENITKSFGLGAEKRNVSTASRWTSTRASSSP